MQGLYSPVGLRAPHLQHVRPWSRLAGGHDANHLRLHGSSHAHDGIHQQDKAGASVFVQPPFTRPQAPARTAKAHVQRGGLRGRKRGKRPRHCPFVHRVAAIQRRFCSVEGILVRPVQPSTLEAT